MTHSTHTPRHTPQHPDQLPLLEDPATEPEPPRDVVQQHPKHQLNELRDQIAAETALLETIREAQDRVVAETIALAKQKRMGTDEIVEAVYDLLGTDHPHNIAERIVHTSLENLVIRLRRKGYDDLADQLRKPLKKPPAPYPSHIWKAKKGGEQ